MFKFELITMGGIIMEEELKKISNRIKEMRRERNVTQKQLAEALEISVTNMCNIENGKTAVTIQNLIKMKNFFSCEMKDFFMDPEVKEIKEVKEAEKPQEQVTEAKPEPAKLPEAIELQDAINLLRLLRRVDIKGI